MKDRIHRQLAISDPWILHYNAKEVLKFRKKMPMDAEVAKLLKNPENAEVWEENINFSGRVFDIPTEDFNDGERKAVDRKEDANGQQEESRTEGVKDLEDVLQAEGPSTSFVTNREDEKDTEGLS